MEQILSVEETQIKDKKCILLRIKGGKQFVLQCEVSLCYFLQVQFRTISTRLSTFRKDKLFLEKQMLAHGRRKYVN